MFFSLKNLYFNNSALIFAIASEKGDQDKDPETIFMRM